MLFCGILLERDVELYEIDGDAIIVIHVPTASRNQKPVFVNGDMYKGSFKRTYEGDYHCTHDEVQAMLRDQNGSLTMVSAKLTRDIEKPFLLEGMARIDDTQVHKSVREALVNCLANADFYLPRGVVIHKYPNRIILKNPGISIVGKRQMLKGGDSEPRNANIMKMLHLLGFGEHIGNGVPDIFEAWNIAGLMEPVVEEHFGEDG